MAATDSSLSAPERETVITTTDADEFVTILTHQRKHITALKRRAGQWLVAEGTYGKTPWAEFKIPADRWSPASGVKNVRHFTEAQKAAAAARMAKAREEKSA